MDLFNEYFGKDKMLRHETQHLLVGVLTLIILYLIFGKLEFWPSIVLLLFATLIADSDHLISLILLPFGKKEYYSAIFQKIKKGQFKAAIEYATTNHKKIVGLLFHNVISGSFFIALSIYLIYENNLGITYFSYAIYGLTAHLIMDFCDDYYQLGHIWNWLWVFSKSKM